MVDKRAIVDVARSLDRGSVSKDGYIHALTTVVKLWGYDGARFYGGEALLAAQGIGPQGFVYPTSYSQANRIAGNAMNVSIVGGILVAFNSFVLAPCVSMRVPCSINPPTERGEFSDDDRDCS